MTPPTISELRARLDAATNETERLSELLTLANKLGDSDPQQGLGFATEAFEHAERLKDDHAAAEALLLIGAANIQLGKHHQANEYLESALSRYEKLGDHMGVARAIGNIGNVHFNHSAFATALENYQSALTLYENRGDREGVAWM